MRSNNLNDRLRAKHSTLNYSDEYGEFPKYEPSPLNIEDEDETEESIMKPKTKQNENLWDGQKKRTKRSKLDKSPLIEVLDDFNEDEEMKKAEKETAFKEDKLKKERKYQIRNKIFSAMMSLACVYLIFLIFGCLCTDYYYNDDGSIVPEVLSVSDVKEKKQFEKLYYQYINVMTIYKKILVLDYRVANNVTGDYITIANDYEALIEDIKNVTLKTKAMTVDPKYEQLKNMLYMLLYSEDNSSYSNFNSYCSAMSVALTENSENAANTAITAREDIYNSFSLITSNILEAGENLNGIDMTEIREFNPDTYADEKIKGNVD